MNIGGWDYSVVEACELPKEVAAGFNEAFSSLLGATYTPVLYCGTQIVHGVNHMIICKVKFATQGSNYALMKVVLNEIVNEGKSSWSIVSVQSIE